MKPITKLRAAGSAALVSTTATGGGGTRNSGNLAFTGACGELAPFEAATVILIGLSSALAMLRRRESV